jgi:hypothetical protein
MAARFLTQTHLGDTGKRAAMTLPGRVNPCTGALVWRCIP